MRHPSREDFSAWFGSNRFQSDIPQGYVQQPTSLFLPFCSPYVWCGPKTIWQIISSSEMSMTKLMGMTKLMKSKVQMVEDQ